MKKRKKKKTAGVCALLLVLVVAAGLFGLSVAGELNAGIGTVDSAAEPAIVMAL